MITKREAAIIGLYTGYTLGKFDDIHRLAEELMGRSIFTHQFASEILAKELHDKVKPLFITLPVEGEDDKGT